MNHEYILLLVEKKRYGTLIRLVRKNIHNWSVQDHTDIKFILKRDYQVSKNICMIHKDFNIKCGIYASKKIVTIRKIKNIKWKIIDGLSNYYHSKYENIHEFYLKFCDLFHVNNMNVGLLKLIVKYMSIFGINICYVKYSQKYHSKIDEYKENPKYINMSLHTICEIDSHRLYDLNISASQKN